MTAKAETPATTGGCQIIAGIPAKTGTPATDASNGRDTSRDDCYNNKNESYSKDSKSRNAKSSINRGKGAPQQYQRQ